VGWSGDDGDWFVLAGMPFRNEAEGGGAAGDVVEAGAVQENAQVQVAFLDRGLIGVRDSKNPTGPAWSSPPESGMPSRPVLSTASSTVPLEIRQSTADAAAALVTTGRRWCTSRPPMVRCLEAQWGRFLMVVDVTPMRRWAPGHAAPARAAA
jgi:hypothetical protein